MRQHSRRTFIFIAAVMVALLSLHLGCLEIPLGDPAKSNIDPQLGGWWEDKEANTITYVSAFDSHAYLITTYGYKIDDGQKKPAYQMTNKAWITHVGDMDIMTFKLVDPHWELQDKAEVNKRYALYRLARTPGKVELSRLNESILTEAKTPEALEKIVADHEKQNDFFDTAEHARTMEAIPASRMDEIKKLVDQFANPG